AAWGYGAWRIRTLPLRELGTVGLVQPNEGFREKWDPAHADSVVAKLVDLSRRLESGGPVALLVWPEAAVPGWLAETPAWDAPLAALARESPSPTLTGGRRAVTRDGYHNAGLLSAPTGQGPTASWYGRTAGPYQHATHLVMRAIETRTGIARAANDGISEFVDPLGRTYSATGLEVEAVVSGRLRTSDVIPPYVRLGDWVGTLCVLA